MTYPRACPACGHGLVERRPLTKTEAALIKMLRWVDPKPSYAEIAEIMDWSSLATVHEYMHRLKDKGYLRFDESLRDQRGPGLGWEIVS